MGVGESTAADVVVIGAGFAGLSAATALAGRGRRVLVVEARLSCGGRASAFTDPVTGERVDNGQHVLFGCYVETFRFLRRIGAESAIALQAGLTVDVYHREGRPSRLTCPAWPPPLHLLGGLLTWKALGWADCRAGLRLRRALTDVRAAETVRTWLDRHRQTPRLVDLLWEPLALAALNEPIDVAAAAPLVAVLRRLFGGSRRDAAIGVPRRPLDDAYVGPACAFIAAHGGEVRTSTTARVRSSPSGAIVELGNASWRPAAIVCAVPWFALPETLEACPELGDVAAAAAATPASPIVTVNLWLDRPVTTAPLVGLPGRAVQWVFDKRRIVGDEASHLSVTASGAAAIVSESNAEIVTRTLEALQVLPPAREAIVRRAVVVRERRATFSHAPGLPPRPATRTPIPNLFLAGDWIDTGLPATIESAALSGHRAAEAAAHT